MSVVVNVEDVKTAFADVKDDSTGTIWAVLKYDGKQIVADSTGEDYDEMLGKFGEDERVYAYARYETGDEMSRSVKFAFITWIGPSVSPLKKAKVSTDKAFVKEITPSFGKEILADDKAEVKYDKVKDILEKASGAAYGTGK